MQQLYIIAPKPDGPCKIGYGANPLKRLRCLQIGSPEKLYLHSTWLSLDRATYQCERLLHGKLWPRRIRGEWFAVSVLEAEQLAASLGMVPANTIPPLAYATIQQALARGRAINKLI